MGEKFQDFSNLDVWKLAHTLRLGIYKLLPFLPEDEKYNIVSQIKRSSCSVGANIAEGYGRYHFQENIQFCRQARGSLEETRDHLMFIRDAKLTKQLDMVNDLLALCESVRPKLNGYIAYLKRQKQDN